jgi:hypothetical protein
MIVERDWRIEFDEGQIERLEGESFTRILARPSGREDWAAALADARALVQPAATWDFRPVREVRHEKVVLDDGARMGGGPFAAVVAGASHLVLAVCTIGSALSNRVRELHGGRHMLRGLLLDDLGSWAVDMVRQQFCKRMEEEASAAGLHVSTCLSPGESEWPLRDQGVIFSLLDATRIGVSLSESLVMTPLKSLSLVMGRGPVQMGHEGGSNCDFCAVKDRCAYRNRRASAAQGKDMR